MIASLICFSIGVVAYGIMAFNEIRDKMSVHIDYLQEEHEDIVKIPRRPEE